jgi:hypothetical protein
MSLFCSERAIEICMLASHSSKKLFSSFCLEETKDQQKLSIKINYDMDVLKSKIICKS